MDSEDYFHNALRGLNWLHWGIRVSVNPIFPALKSLEAEILDSVRKELKDEYREIFESQISSLNVVRRFSLESIEIYLLAWNVKSLEWNYERMIYFDQSQESQRLAKFSIHRKGVAPLEGKLIANKGVLSCIQIPRADLTYRQLANSRDFAIQVNHGLITY